MKTHEFTERAGDDRVVRLNIPVDAPGERYHVVVHVEPVIGSGRRESEYLTDDFINETAGKWIGEFPTDSEGNYEEREPL
jgi:hypothetical protein